VGVDEAGADAAGGREAEVARGLRGEAAERRADGRATLGQRAAGGEVVEAEGRELAARPAGFGLGAVAPLAGEGALGAREAARGAPGEEVGEVEEVARARPGRGPAA